MTDFVVTWKLSRGRFVDAVQDLSQAQLNWRLQPGSLTAGEMALHVAGVEISFISQLLQSNLDDKGQRLKLAATEGVVNDSAFPFSAAEITPELVSASLDYARSMVEPVISEPTAQVLSKEIKSALGPVIDGRGALARLSFHPGYHQGQVHLLRTAPGFPAP